MYVWEAGPRGGIIGLAEVSEPPRIQPEPKEQLLFIRNSEKFRGDRLRVKTPIAQADRTSDSTDVSFIAGGIRYLEHLAAPAGHEFSRDARRSKSPGRHCGRHGCGSCSS